jgi:beta-glucanase (GH16 family)
MFNWIHHTFSRLLLTCSLLGPLLAQTQSIEHPKEPIMKNVNWQLIWSDEFDGPQIDSSKWNFQVLKAGQFNEEWQRYTNNPKNAFIENKQLVIKAIHESKQHGLDQYTSARLNTAGKFSFTYGKISARIKLPEGEGIWPAFWMLGANIDENGGDTPWPLCGEIDILELYGSKNDSTVEANIHYADNQGKHSAMGAVDYTLNQGKFSDDFHIFELVWDEKHIAWLVDGKQYAETKIDSATRTEFHKPFFLLLNIAVGGTFAGRPNASTPFPQAMYVDWIRVYQNK